MYKHSVNKPEDVNFNDKNKDIDFLFDIIKEVKHFYETPVIFLTHKDYADDIFNALCSMRTALQKESKIAVMDLIVDFHLKWLKSIDDVEEFKKRVNDLERHEIYKAVNFSIDALSARLKYYQRYTAKYRSCLSNDDQSNLIADDEIVEEMHKEVIQCLKNKLKCFKNFDSDDEFKIKVVDSIEELLQWIDKINDNLAMLFSKYINVNMPHISGDLFKTLQQIVDEFHNSTSPSVQKILSDFRVKGIEMGTMIRCTVGHTLEMAKLSENIHTLENRISRLQDEPNSAALLALSNRKEYLEKRLWALENSKITLKDIKKSSYLYLENIDDKELCSCEDFYQLRIFNHSLPPEDRERLVTELCRHWDTAVFGERGHKSIISILSAADAREEYNDENGTFYIDEYSRKIYKVPNEEIMYQINELGKLVALSDDTEHIYFYDECGRYYIDQKTRQRIYKANATASEYIMDNTGILLKTKEERAGVTYYYDNYGRYYINEEGKHIYREADSVSEYQNDGLGNLVRLRSHLDIFDPCPPELSVTEDSKYLQLSVGNALRRCIADVILHQPADPIKYLAASLKKYRDNIELKENLRKEEEELNMEREIKIAEERAAASRLAMEAAYLAQGESEASYDSNLVNYTSIHPNDIITSTSSKQTKNIS